MSGQPKKGALEATRQTIRFFETLLRASADGIVITDSMNNIVRVNEAFCGFFGQQRWEMIETNLLVWLEQLDGSATARWAKIEENVRNEESFSNVEFRMTAPVERYLSINASLLEKVGDEESGVIISIWRDITELKLAEIALQKSRDGLEEQVKERTAELLEANEELRTEMTERKRAEAAAMEGEQQVRDLLNSTAEAIVGVDLQGICTFANPASVQLLGCRDADELTGGTLHQYFHHTRPDGTPYPKEECPMYRSLATGERNYTNIEVMWRDDGSSFPAEYWSYPIRREGELVGSVVSFLDITEKKLTEELLKRMRRAKETLAMCTDVLLRATEEDELTGGICEKIVSEGRYVLAWVGIAEYDEARTVRPVANAGYNPGFINSLDISWRDNEKGRGPTATAIRTGKPAVFQNILTDERYAYLRRGAGETGYASSIALPLIGVEEMIGALTIYSTENDAFFDAEVEFLVRLADDLAYGLIAIREKKARKEAEHNLMTSKKSLQEAQKKVVRQEKMASIGLLAAGIAHEINNPTGFILSNLNTLRKYSGRISEYLDILTKTIDDIDSEKVHAFIATERKRLKLDFIMEDLNSMVEESVDGAHRIKKIVQDLKSFSRTDNIDEYIYADIHKNIDTTINIIWNELKYKVDLRKEYGEIPKTMCFDRQLNQVFMNILVNAAQAIEKHGDVTIKTRREGDSIFIAISDTGAGVPEEMLLRVFDPFFTTKEPGKGTGLGLSISYDIVMRHGGELTVDSVVGKGTTFTVTLPVRAEGTPMPETKMIQE